MLMSAGLPLPRQVFGHGWVHFKGQRMSKSLGTVVDPLEAADRLGPDPLRLYLVKEIPYGGDGDFSWERFEERYNVDLANNLGNLVSRVTTMVEQVPRGCAWPPVAGRIRTACARWLSRRCRRIARRWIGSRCTRPRPPSSRWSIATNEFIATSEPWTLAKDPATRGRADAVLFDVAETVRIAAVLLLPVMPAAAAEILRRVGEPAAAGDAAPRPRRGVEGESRANCRERARRSGRASNRGRPADSGPSGEKSVSDQTSHPRRRRPHPSPQADGTSAPASAADAATAGKPAAPGVIDIDEFMKIELRVAKVLAAERVPKSKKLMKLRVDAGTEERTIVAGIAEAYEPETLVGRTIVIVANLKPAKLMGIESNGMVLAASPEGGKPDARRARHWRRAGHAGPVSATDDGRRVADAGSVVMIDSHCHLADEVFEADLDEVDRAREGRRA